MGSHTEFEWVYAPTQHDLIENFQASVVTKKFDGRKTGTVFGLWPRSLGFDFVCWVSSAEGGDFAV